MSNVDMAAGYVRRIVAKETTGWGDNNEALKRIAEVYRLPFWSLRNLLIGRRKTVDSDLLYALRRVYLDYCQRQMDELLTELEQETKAVGADDDLSRLEAEASELAAKIAAKRAALNALRGET